MNSASFISTCTIESDRAQKRLNREEALKDAQERFLLENEKAKIKRSLGILDSVEKRLLKEPKVKKSKDKKKKKHKKKSKRRSSSLSQSSQSDIDEWIEKSPDKSKRSKSPPPSKDRPAKDPPPERDSWMQEDFLLNLPMSDTSSVSKKNNKAKNREDRDMFDKPGQHARELNPYWKDGGGGLPENKPSLSAPTLSAAPPDVSWLLRSLKRMKEQSEETGRDIEDIAAERYGSWKTFNDMLDRAQNNFDNKAAIYERSSKLTKRRDSRERHSNSRFMKPDMSKESSHKKYKRPDDAYPGNGSSPDSFHSKYKRSDDAPWEKRGTPETSKRKSRRSHSQDSYSDSRNSPDSPKKKFRNPEEYHHENGDTIRNKSKRSDNTFAANKDSPDVSQSKFRKPDSFTQRKDSPAVVRGKFKRPEESFSDSVNFPEYKGLDPTSRVGGKKSNSSARWRKEKHDRDSPKNNKRIIEVQQGDEHNPEASNERKEVVQKHAVMNQLDSADGTNSRKQETDKPSTNESPIKEENPRPKILTQEQKNAIGSKILKAELRGNHALAEKLKNKLERSRQAEEELKSMPTPAAVDGQNLDTEDTVILTRMTKTGQAWPVMENESNVGASRKKSKLAKVHAKDGAREKYFADDDQYSLNDLITRERSGIADDHTEVLSRMSAKLFRKTDGEMFTLDDMFESQVSKTNLKSAEVSADRNRAISQHKKMMRRLERCKYCFGNAENAKHLIISIGQYAYLSVPSCVPLQSGHCIIAPLYHCASATAMDENVWAEIRKFMQSLVRMFRNRKQDCVFLQICSNLKSSYHFRMECIPVDIEIGEMAPIYFKKAIQDCDEQWAQNKKLIDTRGCRDGVRGKVPAGLPYFAVDFGLDGGFAHVIENESLFPPYFGREIVGGMIDADPTCWRKPKEQHFSQQSTRTLEFEKWFKDYDWTSTEITA